MLSKVQHASSAIKSSTNSTTATFTKEGGEVLTAPLVYVYQRMSLKSNALNTKRKVSPPLAPNSWRTMISPSSRDTSKSTGELYSITFLPTMSEGLTSSAG